MTPNVSKNTTQWEYFPVALFGSVMGLCGLSVAWKKAHLLWHMPIWIHHSLAVVSVLVFVVLVSGYALKTLLAWQQVKAEFLHPSKGALFGTLIISGLLIPILIVNQTPLLAKGMWMTASIAMLMFALHWFNRWLNGGFVYTDATPAWIMPLVGFLNIPLAVPSLGFSQPPEVLMHFSLAIGLFFATPLLVIILSRIMFKEPLNAAELPSLFILLAPFSLGFLAYSTTVGQVDSLAEGLFYIALFLLSTLFIRLRYLPIACPFKVAWWSVSFPLAATTNAALTLADAQASIINEYIAMGLLALTSLIIALLFLRTLVILIMQRLPKFWA